MQNQYFFIDRTGFTNLLFYVMMFLRRIRNQLSQLGLLEVAGENRRKFGGKILYVFVEPCGCVLGADTIDHGCYAPLGAALKRGCRLEPRAGAIALPELCAAHHPQGEIGAHGHEMQWPILRHYGAPGSDTREMFTCTRCGRDVGDPIHAVSANAESPSTQNDEGSANAK